MGDQRSGGGEEPGQGVAEVLFTVGFGEIAVHVLDGGLQDVEPVAQVVQRRSGHDQLGLAQTGLRAALTSAVVRLAAGRPAELPGAAGTGAQLEAATAPAAPLAHTAFRH